MSTFKSRAKFFSFWKSCLHLKILNFFLSFRKELVIQRLNKKRVRVEIYLKLSLKYLENYNRLLIIELDWYGNTTGKILQNHNKCQIFFLQNFKALKMPQIYKSTVEPWNTGFWLTGQNRFSEVLYTKSLNVRDWNLETDSIYGTMSCWPSCPINRGSNL